MTIEDALRQIREKVALLRYLASSATVNDEWPDRDVLAGVATLSDEVAELALAIARTVPASTLAAELKAARR